MTANTPAPARLMSAQRHLFIQFGGQLVTILMLVMIATLGWVLDGEPAGFPWSTVLMTTVIFGPIFGYIGFRLAAPFILCHDCRAIGYVDDIRRLKRCPACRSETFYWLPWSARPNPWALKAYRPAVNAGPTMSAAQVIEKGEKMDSIARSFIRLG